MSETLINKLKRFGIGGKITAVKPGPVVTLFEFAPAEDAKISRILALENDLALALQTKSIRIIAPVPGKAVVGFEVANPVRESVLLSDVLQDFKFTKFVASVQQGQSQDLPYQIPIALGKDTVGGNLIIDLVKTPHLLVAGSTGSGKSVALNSVLVSLLCANPPARLRLILVDPKQLEFAKYAGMGHLLFPIASDAKKVLVILRWVVREMERRYAQMATVGVRNLADYNEYLLAQPQAELEQLPYIVLVIDELADLMMTSGKEVEDLIIRIAQMARAAGIHLIVATQRPSVDVVTGLIKVNFPSRIAFRVASKADSRTILDANGADTLLGSGDMLFLSSQSASLSRAHGAYVSDREVQEVVNFVKQHYPTNYLNLDQSVNTVLDDLLAQDALLTDVLGFLKEHEEVSVSLLQRRFRIGYNRSARIMDLLEDGGYVLPLEGGKLRKVIKDRLH
jgi:S-DNA-T family DNA segregation ATPase FtsK/SpoIIIE